MQSDTASAVVMQNRPEIPDGCGHNSAYCKFNRKKVKE